MLGASSKTNRKESSPISSQSAVAQVPIKATLLSETVIIDGVLVPKTVVDLIGILELRITSLETQLHKLKEKIPMEQAPQQNDPHQGAMRALLNHQPEDEEKRPLRVGGNWTPVEDVVPRFPENEEKPSFRKQRLNCQRYCHCWVCSMKES